MNKTYEELLKDLLNKFQYITVDFGTGEIITDPLYKGCLGLEDDLE